MWRTIILTAALLAAGVAYGMGVRERTEEQGAATAETSFRMRSEGGAASCTVTRGAEIAGGLSTLAVSPACGTVLPGIEQARFWREADDGTVAFSRDGRDELVRFALADGIDYESFAPRQPLISLAGLQR